MATVEFKVNLDPLWSGLEKLRAQAAANGALQQRLLRIMGRSFVSVARRAFRDASLQVPSPWPAYKLDAQGRSRYAERKLARGRNQMLIDTGTLVESLMADEPSGGKVRVHSAAPYARWHHSGTQKGMPMRRFFPVTGGDADSAGALTPAGEAAIKSALEAVWRSIKL